MNKIVKMYWDCPYCENHDIDGLIDICPGCGRHKPENTEYHLPGGRKIEFGKKYSESQILENDIATEKELCDAGISQDECDGNHKEWVCSYCNSLNNWADEYCASCNSPKNDAVYEYGMQKRKQNAKYEAIKEHPTVSSNIEYQQKNVKHHKSIRSDFFNPTTWWKFGLAAVVIFLIAFLFWPYKVTTEVTGFHWERNIYLEEYRTVRESDWNVPQGGRVYDTKTEIRSYVSVIDHYETVTETKSRQVIDHYETSYYYTDNGNGTATEHTTSTPVYTTEYYTETHEEPVYRQDPVYDTKYYYEIERWVHTGEEYASSGNDHEPYWNTEYLPLNENERDTDRTEKYVILYDNNTKTSADYDMWINTELGDKIDLTKCRLGIVYQQKPVLAE